MNYSLRIQALAFSVLFVWATSCNGQTKTTQADGVVKQLPFTSRNKKLTKTQGTTEHQNVHCSLQDKEGNIWFGTTGEGVYRYDGKEFTQFTVKDGLSNNKVWSILEDRSGNIWLGTDDGVSRYDGTTISKIPFTITNPGGFGTAIPQAGQNAVWSMLQDKSGIIWFGTSLDLYCYDGKSFSRFLDRTNIINNQNLQLKWIQCFLEDSNGTVWMGSGPIAEEGVIRFDGKSITGDKPNSDGWIRYMVKDKSGAIWFSGRHNGVFRYNGQAFEIFKEKTNIGSAIFKDRTGNVWFDGGEKLNTIESIDGLWRYHPSASPRTGGQAFVNFSGREGMGKYSVWSMLEDKSGNIWIGTRNCGLYRYNGQIVETFSE